MAEPRVSPADVRRMLDFLFSLQDRNGTWRAAPDDDYLGISDCLYNDTSAAAYVAELLLTLGVEHPNPAQTVEFIQARQTPEGYFKPLDPRCACRWYPAHATWKSLRGLRALGARPLYDPLPFVRQHSLEQDFRSPERFSPYAPDMLAGCYDLLDVPMPAEVASHLVAQYASRIDPLTGWFVQTSPYPFALMNPMTFHAMRTYLYAGRGLERPELVLEWFLRMQERNGSWTNGGVHGTANAAVVIRTLGDDSERCRNALRRAGKWILESCWNQDGGFNHLGDGKPSEVDACYFHIATLVMADMIPTPLTPACRWIGIGHMWQNGQTPFANLVG
ncbi:MAG: hypothetical protein RBU25_10820 [Lentisphaeria bacterium]|jgi:hypothetical protein|nr:hypothetical protein [Lentisphaeria bacterium]